MWREDRAKLAHPAHDTAGSTGFDAPAALRARVPGHPFKADLDLAEIDDRQRPGPSWAARAHTLSRSHLVVLSRRMSYPKRIMLVAVHLIDARPTPLVGKVLECEYHAEGMYRIVLELLPLPEPEILAIWFPHGILK
jgi:hypothetical protein